MTTMYLALFILFLCIPLLEIATFIMIGGAVGIPLTLFGIVLTAVIGAFLVQKQGVQTLNAIRQNMNNGVMPARDLFHGGCLLVAGAMLLTPGFVTDTVGFLLLVPLIRDKLMERVLAWGKFNVQTHYDDTVIEGEWKKNDQKW